MTTATSSWVGRCDGCAAPYDEASHIQIDGRRFCTATCWSAWEDDQLSRLQTQAAEKIDAGQKPEVKFDFWPPLSWF